MKKSKLTNKNPECKRYFKITIVTHVDRLFIQQIFFVSGHRGKNLNAFGACKHGFLKRKYTTCAVNG